MTQLFLTDLEDDDEDTDEDMCRGTPTGDARFRERTAIAAAAEVALALHRIPFLVTMLQFPDLTGPLMVTLLHNAGRPARKRPDTTSLAERMAAEDMPTVSADDGSRPTRTARLARFIQQANQRANPSERQASATPTVPSATFSSPSATKRPKPRILGTDTRLLPPEPSGE